MGTLKTAMASINGRCSLLVTGANTEAVLNRCAAERTEIFRAEKKNEYTLLVEIPEPELKDFERTAQRCMCDCELVGIRGGSNFALFLKNHIFFFAALTATVALVFASSLFVWDIKVCGNERLSDGELIRALSECGVDIGTYRGNIENDIVRSKMLLRLPELAWMSVNVSGSRATLLVSERLEKPEIYMEGDYSDVVATSDGIIDFVLARSGTAPVSRGQAVKKGETLIDGTVESITAPPRFVNADGSVIARTHYEITAVSPRKIQKKTECGAVRHRFALLFGKKRINFYINSGNTVDECDKIIHNHKIGKKGVFSLPITVVHEKAVPYKTLTVSTDCGGKLLERLREELDNDLDGQVLYESSTQDADGNLVSVTLCCDCLENIAEKIKR